MTAKDIWLGLLVISIAAFAAMGLWFALGLPEDGLGVAIIGASVATMFGYEHWLEQTGRKPAPPGRST